MMRNAGANQVAIEAARSVVIRATLPMLMMAVAAAGCEQDPLASELDSDGPPRVTAVAALSEALVAGGASPAEATVYCGSAEDDKLSVICVGQDGAAISPGPVADVPPIDWYVRLVFNELLDADRAEELVVVSDPANPGEPLRDQYGDAVTRGTLERSQPVTLTCNGAAVAYDGFYNPSGNHLSTPPGPSLVVQALSDVATGSECEVAIRRGETNPGFGVFDKSGNPIDPAQRGPFSFRIAPMAIASVTPPDESEGVALDVVPAVTFNARVEVDSLNESDDPRIVLRTADGAAVAVVLDVQGATVTVEPVDALAPETSYELVVNSGVSDVAGGPGLAVEGDSAVVSTFTTGPADSGS